MSSASFDKDEAAGGTDCGFGFDKVNSSNSNNCDIPRREEKMSTKSGLKKAKTFSWRFGPSKFGRKSKSHSEVGRT